MKTLFKILPSCLTLFILTLNTYSFAVPVIDQSTIRRDAIIDITNTNRAIRQISQDFENKITKALNNTDQSSSDYSSINRLQQSFMRALNNYKPDNQNWASFNPISFHNINANDNRDLMSFATYLADKSDQLANISQQLDEVTQSLNNKNTYGDLYYEPSYQYLYREDRFPFYNYYGYLDYYPYFYNYYYPY